ncbi:unnamed protein product [Mytilus coruscus]|uniref:Uncharacterized protein n=1 Tax=Mytilus coruscus TaxID=42192 RepID=A0A6J8BK36_MYTCO|nr:unnamed protein product [Mytilus coruscus]
MKSVIILFLVFLVFDRSRTEESESTGPNCEQILSMPLLDNMEATLKADLDVRTLNKFLQTFIREVVKIEVANVIHEDMKKIMNESVSDVESIFDDRTNEMKLGLDSKFDELTKKIMNESVSDVESLFDDRTNEMKHGLDSKFDELTKKIMNESVSNVESLFDDRTNEIKLDLDSKFDELMKKKAAI